MWGVIQSIFTVVINTILDFTALLSCWSMNPWWWRYLRRMVGMMSNDVLRWPGLYHSWQTSDTASQQSTVCQPKLSLICVQLVPPTDTLSCKLFINDHKIISNDSHLDNISGNSRSESWEDLWQSLSCGGSLHFAKQCSIGRICIVVALHYLNQQSVSLIFLNKQ